MFSYKNLAFQVMQSDILHFFFNLTRKIVTCWGIQILHFKWFIKISLPQSNKNEKSNMLSYTTECPVTIYRIEIICRKYKSTLKIMLSISTQALPRWPAHRQAHGTMWLGPIPQRKKANFPTLGPRFLVKFPRVGKAKEVNLRPVGSVGRALGFCEGGRGINPPHRPTLRVFKINWGEKCCLCNDICKWLDFLVFSDKDDKT